MTQRCTNHPSHCESLNVVQIFQRCIIPWLYKSFEVVQILQRSKKSLTLYKSFNVIQIIQRNKNHSTQYKSFNAVLQIIHLCTKNSTLNKSFNVVQIFQRSTNHSTQYKSFSVVQIFQILLPTFLLSIYILSYNNLEEI